MGVDTVWNWHFMANGWAAQETFDVKFGEPIAIVISEIPKGATKIVCV